MFANGSQPSATRLWLNAVGLAVGVLGGCGSSKSDAETVDTEGPAASNRCAFNSTLDRAPSILSVTPHRHTGGMAGFDPVGAMAAAVSAGSAFAPGEGDALHARVEVVMAEAQALVGRVNADHAVLATKTVELMSLWNAGADLGWGFRSVEHRLANELELTQREAKLLTTAARNLPELPELTTAFGLGVRPLTIGRP